MKKNNLKIGLYLLPIMFLVSCLDFGSDDRLQTTPAPDEADGWAPVYAADGIVQKIESQAPKEIDKGGKIYVKDHFLYQVEVGKGVHITNIANPASPQKVRFIQVTGAQEMSIMGNIMYTNNVNDLVAIDIADINNVKVLGRTTGVFHLVDATLPPASGYFECVDPAKGTVIGWETKKLYKPVCRKF